MQWRSLAGEIEPAHFEYTCQLKARDNYTKEKYKDVFIALVKAAGYDPEIIDVAPMPEPLGFGTKAEREAVEKENALRVATAPDISDEEYQTLQKDGKATREIKAQISRHLLQTLYPESNIDDPERVLHLSIKKGGRWAAGVTRYWMSQNLDVSSHHHAKKWLARAKNDNITPFDAPTEYPKIKALVSMRLGEIMLEDEPIDCNDPRVIAFVDRIKTKHKAELKTLGIDPKTKLEGIQFINKLLGFYSVKWVTPDKGDTRKYKLEFTSPPVKNGNLRQEIEASLTTRFLPLLLAENPYGERLPASIPIPDSLYNKTQQVWNLLTEKIPVQDC
jgi:hypothetical protein